MTTIPKWAIFLALGMIGIAATFVIVAARKRIDLDNKAKAMLDEQSKSSPQK